MKGKRRWDPCVAHVRADVDKFLNCYMEDTGRKVLLVAGAGFDPRSLVVATKLANHATDLRALLINEIRPSPSREQLKRAEENARSLSNAITRSELLPVDIFESDGAVVGGRTIISALRRQSFGGVTDVIVDISALSVGTSFPLIRYFVESLGGGQKSANLHLFVTHDPQVDARIRSIPSDTPSYVHGFKGGSTLFDAGSAAKLWLPQLAVGRRGILAKLHDFIEPHDTCPILPFPASDPRLGDMLAEEYLTELESTWLVDTRNLVYADEGDPLDLYRTILTLEDRRRPVFADSGGSMLVLSPLGSKVMALGALMAALERDLPVAYVEPIDYELDSSVPEGVGEPNLIHVWLEGEAYPQPRPTLGASRNSLEQDQ